MRELWCAKCHAPNYFLGPLTLGNELPPGPIPWPGARYPQSITRQPDDEEELLTLREEPHQTRDLTARTISLRASSANETDRSVECIIASEDPVAVLDMRTWTVIDEVLRMDGADLPPQVPLLYNHYRYSLNDVLGSARGAAVKGKQAAGRLYFAEGDEDSERAWQKVKQGHLADVSAGYRSIEYVDIAAGTRGVVKGKEYRASKERTLRVTTRWQLREVSLVPIGADPRAKIRELPHSGDAMNPMLRAYLEKLGLRKEATDAQAQAFLAGLGQQQRAVADVVGNEDLTDTIRSAALRGLNVNPDAPWSELAIAVRGEVLETDPVTARAAAAGTLTLDTNQSQEELRQRAVAEERQRISRIRELAGDDVPVEMVRRAESEGWDEPRTSREFLSAVRERRAPPVGPGIHSRSHENDCTLRSLAAGLLISQGVDPVAAQTRSHDGRRHGARFTAQEAELGDRYRALAFIDVLRECVRIDTGRYSLDFEDTLRAATSGATFSHVFSTNVYARLIMGWEKVADTTQGWCDEEDVPNFLQQEDISLTASARPEKLPRGDTAKDATASDTHETYKIARFAKKFVVDEQDVIDDRLGAIMKMPMELGEQARELRPNLVYNEILANPTLVADSVAVFSVATHVNLLTGGLSSDNLKLAITAMGKQRENNRVLNLKPQYLLVPSALEWKADELTTAAMLAKLFADSNDPYYAPENLIARKRLRVVMDDRLGASGVVNPHTGSVRAGSDTAWYLTAGGSKGLRVAYRRGTGRQPQMRSFLLDRGQWGMGWDINFDIGVAFMDYRPWFKSTGAA